MRKNYFKRATAITLAAMMVLGSAMTAFATEGGESETEEVTETKSDKPATTGNSQGAGTSEGHVDEKSTSVTLPTDVADTTFAYTMDPEGLIKTTAGGRYTNANFPAAASDTGVYFLTGNTEGETSYKQVEEAKKDDIGDYYEKDAPQYEYVKTEDETVAAEKTYYTQDASDDTKYDEVSNPADTDIGTYYERVTKPDTYTKTTDTDVDSNKTYYIKETASGTATYTNSSSELKVINQSSHAIKLTVKAEAIDTNASTDIPLVAKSALTNATNASLYLGLQVGAVTEQNPVKAITKETAAVIEVQLDGSASNFKIDAKEDKSGYEYRELTIAEYNEKHKEDDNFTALEDGDSLPWKSTTFKLEGQTTTGKKITSTTTAPKVKVTWSWTDPTADAAPSIKDSSTNYKITANTDVIVNVDLGNGSSAATGIKLVTFKGNDGSTNTLAASNYTFADNKLTLKKEFINNLVGKISSRSYTITFNNTAETTAGFNLVSQ